MKNNRNIFSKSGFSRRRFLKCSAAGGLGVMLASGFLNVAAAELPKPELSRYTPGARTAFERITWDKTDGARHIVGFNYQPTWGSTGPEIWVDKFDAAKYKAELARGKELFPQMNTVRIWLSWGAWKKASLPEKMGKFIGFREAS